MLDGEQFPLGILKAGILAFSASEERLPFSCLANSRNDKRAWLLDKKPVRALSAPIVQIEHLPIKQWDGGILNPPWGRSLTTGREGSEAVNVASHNGAGPLIAVCRMPVRQGVRNKSKMWVKIPCACGGDSELAR